MANENNLLPLNKRTKSEQREIAKMGGIKSGEVRRNKKTLREELEIALTIKDEITGEDNRMTITKALIRKAARGDVKAYEVIRDTIGEKPTDKQEIQIPVHNYPKVFVSLEDLSDTEKMERILKNANRTEIIYVSPEEQKIIDEHIEALLND